MTFASNLVSLVALPFAFPFWVRSDSDADALLSGIDVPSGSVLVKVLLVIALPLAPGLLAATRAPASAARFRPSLAPPLFSVTMYW